jgi:hypothetical protein
MLMDKKIDYAPHYLEAKKKIDEAYRMLLVHEYEDAATLISDTIAELRLMRAAVRSHVE